MDYAQNGRMSQLVISLIGHATLEKRPVMTLQDQQMDTVAQDTTCILKQELRAALALQEIQLS